MQAPESHQEKWLSGFMKETFKEQKRTRRWGIFFKLLTFTYLFVGLFLFMSTGLLDKNTSTQEERTAMVVVNGVIAADEEANANSIVSSLRAAFRDEHAKAVMMVINSPGGSPVQAGYVNDEIKRLRGLYPDKKLYAVIAELGASGGYYMAVAADQIYADKASLVGSIGVTASGFGFVGLMDKVGVERRHYTSGEHKAFLDPFSPAKAEEGEFWQAVLDSTHQQFINVVEEGRGDRLVKDNKDLYSGLIWNGEQALAMGLIDGLGSPGFVAREVIQAEEIVDYSIKPSPLESFTEQLGLSIGEGVATLLNSSNTSMELR
ncbi:MAG: S49 family peptidase [Psychromonas sp.]